MFPRVSSSYSRGSFCCWENSSILLSHSFSISSKAFDDVGLEGFPLFFVGVVVFIGDEVSICAVESEHQTM